MVTVSSESRLERLDMKFAAEHAKKATKATTSPSFLEMSEDETGAPYLLLEQTYCNVCTSQNNWVLFRRWMKNGCARHFAFATSVVTASEIHGPSLNLLEHRVIHSNFPVAIALSEAFPRRSMSLATGPRCMVASRSRPCALRLRESIRASEPAFSRARLAICSHNRRMATTSSAAEPRPTLRRLVSESSIVDFFTHHQQTSCITADLPGSGHHKGMVVAVVAFTIWQVDRQVNGNAVTGGQLDAKRRCQFLARVFIQFGG